MGKLDRNLHFYEIICSTLGICFMVDFKTKGCLLTKSQLQKALELLKTKHPYLRMKIGKSFLGAPKFIEQSVQEQKVDVIEYSELNNEDDFNDWQARIMDISNKPRDFNSSLIFLNIYSLPSVNRYQLYCLINHSGTDGLGIFSVAKDLLTVLDLLLVGIEPSIEPRKFEDFHSYYNSNINVQDLKAEKLITENFLQPISSIPEPNPQNCKAKLCAQFIQLDKQTTEKLVISCRKNKTTVQGALSIAALVGLLKTIKTDLSKPIRTVLSAPCNMRNYIEPQLSHEDMVCGTAGLNWVQDLNEKNELWLLAKEATENVHKLRDTDDGMKWLLRLKNMLPLQTASSTTSSIGVANLEENKLKNIQLIDVQMGGGSYSLENVGCTCITHAFTCLGRLTIVMSYTYPLLSVEWSKEYVNCELAVLNYFAENPDSQKTLNEFLNELK